MSNAEVPDRVLQFISKWIDTVPELETLLIMSADETRAWSGSEIAALTYVSPAVAAGVLDRLTRIQLLVTVGDGGHYRFCPSSDEDRQLVSETASAYRRHLIPLTKFIHKKAPAPVQEFARAFSLKKDR